jgi:transposase-like protein
MFHYIPTPIRKKLGIKLKCGRKKGYTKLPLETIRDIAAQYERGKTLTQLAEKHNTNPSTIRKWVLSQGVKTRSKGRPKKTDAGPPPSAVRVLTALDNRKPHQSPIDVAKELGVSRQYVYWVLKQYAA